MELDDELIKEILGIINGIDYKVETAEQILSAINSGDEYVGVMMNDSIQVRTYESDYIEILNQYLPAFIEYEYYELCSEINKINNKIKNEEVKSKCS